MVAAQAPAVGLTRTPPLGGSVDLETQTTYPDALIRVPPDSCQSFTCAVLYGRLGAEPEAARVRNELLLTSGKRSSAERLAIDAAHIVDTVAFLSCHQGLMRWHQILASASRRSKDSGRSLSGL
jgi:hypothetical protein